jgi:hypothetical protein
MVATNLVENASSMQATWDPYHKYGIGRKKWNVVEKSIYDC